ncbi:MAG: Gfo/Idh/MocA family oxidoreductase [Deltaproteobacteria bacterium]|nr:MAG: Gfo/Idh/MocA family oxidoreductase [Deltaproteobacteria bacterium]
MSVESQLRVGVIGVGVMGRNHARVYAELGHLVAIADPDAEAAKAVGERFGVPTFDDYRALLDGAAVDAVSIATATTHHHAIARACLEAGVHSLVEKPLCATAAEARDLIELARERGRVLAVGHIERHNPAVLAAKAALDRGEFGPLLSLSARRVSSFPARIGDVGVMLDLAVHEVDVQRFLVGRPVVSVYARAGRQGHERFEDRATLLLEFEGDVTGVIEVNWRTPIKARTLTLTCESRLVSLDYTRQSMTVSSARLHDYDPGDLSHVPLEYDVLETQLRWQEPLKRELLDFLEAVRSGRAPLVTGSDGLEAIRIIEGALEADRTGAAVRFRGA